MTKHCTDCKHLRYLFSDSFYYKPIKGDAAKACGWYCLKYSRWDLPESDIVGIKTGETYLAISPYEARASEEQCGKEGRDFEQKTSVLYRLFEACVKIRYKHSARRVS